MSTSYDEILKRARSELSAEEQSKLINELHASSSKGHHSVLELEGLGQHVWEGLVPEQYIRQERDSWNG
ncbi:MAG TPA: hypothetical protein VFW73_08735 [Lacipirellulaceae bacterium]|nr:hypothetical protein [Lacipirellulaceae bacterium]